ncbi:MAG: hypothetical protein OEM02_00130 [Desulfobulbaceae bacterium]|nr:hypothetical protein [Desulfobulbaceae bacterium]
MAINERACCSLGYSWEELVTMNMSEIATISEQLSLAERYWHLPCSEPAMILAAKYRFKKGETFPVAVNMGDYGFMRSAFGDLSGARYF